MEHKSIMEMKNIVRAFPVEGAEPFYALKGVDAYIPRGGFTVLKGRSGSGKTTLMNIIGALDLPTSGSVRIGGQDIVQLSEQKREMLRRTKVGFVFQSVSLMPSMNALQNVEFSLRLAEATTRSQNELINILLDFIIENNVPHTMKKHSLINECFFICFL